MPTTTVYLVRHGEALHDGQLDDPGLSPLGELQAAAVARRLSWLDLDPAPDAVLHSSRRRARETAAIIAASHLAWPCRLDDSMEDRTPVPDDLTDVPERYHGFLESVEPPERDQGGHLLDRAVASLGAVGDADRNIVGVTHAFVIAWFVRAVLDAPRWRWISLPVSNGSLTVLRWDSEREPRLLAFDDTGHLK